jgi:D-alanyl-D-alanine carboxypeptidase
MVSTPADLARFYDALLGGDLLPAAQVAAMRDTIPIDERRGYGYGLYRFQFDEDMTGFGHYGVAPGYTSLVVRIDKGRTVVLYRNSFDKVLRLPWNNLVVAAALG